MNIKQDKKQVLNALHLAKKDGYSYKEIAQEAGLPYTSLRNFTTRGSLGKHKLEILYYWLISKNYLSSNEISSTSAKAIQRVKSVFTYDNETTVPELQQLLGVELITLAEIMLNQNFTYDFKVKRFRTYINSYHGDLDLVCDAIKNPKKNSNQ